MDTYAIERTAMAMAIALMVALLTTWAVLGYARRSGMLDLPGRRRSHDRPTPRGGGAGLVLGAMAGIGFALHDTLRPPSLLVAMLVAALLVAVMGWLDDRNGLPAWPRLIAHVVAAGGFCLLLVAAAGLSTLWLAVLIPLAVWSINLHNFMDGTDALLGLQLVFVGLAGGALCMAQGWVVLGAAHMALSAAATGFLVFNLPPARIFMGDVGSGFAGLLVFMLGMLWCVDDPHAAWVVLILNAAFATDATMTLLSRLLRGRRWYAPHREHLYQWLARAHFTHGQVAGMYLLYNLVVLAPMAWMAMREPSWAPAWCTGAYALSALAWLYGKARCGGGRRARA